MANKAALGAALTTLGQSIPRYTAGVFDKIRELKKEKNEAPYLEKQRDLDLKKNEQSVEAGKQSLALGQQNVETGDERAAYRKEAIALSATIKGEIAAEKIKLEHKNTVDSTIKAMPIDELYKEYKTYDPEEARKIAYSEIELPTGQTDQDIIAKYRTDLERLQYATQEAQGLMTGVSQRDKRADAEAATLEKQTEGAVGFERSKELKRMTLEAGKEDRGYEASLRRPEVERRESTAQHQQLESYRKNTQTSRDKIQTIGFIDKLIPGGIFGERKDAEGKVPVIGVGIKPFRKWLLDDASTDMRVYINQLFNTNIKEQSGAAVTAAEFKRMEEVMGLGTRSTVNQFKTYMKTESIKAYRKLDEAEKTLTGPSIYAARERYLTASEIPFLPDEYKTSKISGGSRDFGEEFNF